MCGLAGVVFWDGPPAGIDPDGLVHRMTGALSHRGPDGAGVVRASWPDDRAPRAPHLVMGHRRLAVIDLTDRAAQPMRGASGRTWVTYNGEIYNFRDVRRELERLGRTFHSDSDTEVLLQGYEQWGRGVLERLRGMFAAAIWDARAGDLVLVRDRLGVKPLYYHQDDRFLVFASEVRALLASGLVPRRLDLVALDQYLAYQAVPAPRTLVDGVCMLEPGHVLAATGRGRVSVEPYWDLLASASSEARGWGVEESRRRIADLLRESAALHLVSDVPVGVFLSGGIDSSALASLLREAGVTPRTFSVGFSEAAYDEARHARTVADHFQTEHTEIRLEGSRLSGELPELLSAADQPSGDGINTAVVSRAVRGAGLKVALSGLGGDEIFGGYPSFARLGRFMRWSRAWAHAPAAVRTLVATAVEGAGRSAAATKAAAILRTDGSLAAAFPVTRQLFGAAARHRLLVTAAEGPAAAAGDDPYVSLLAAAYAHSGGVDVGSLVSYAEARTYMHDVLLRDADQMSMAWGLEVRVPLLDHELAQCVVGLPDAMRFENGQPKPLLTRSLGLALPETVVNRRKQGFTLPFDPWMRGPLRAFCERQLCGPAGLSARAPFDEPAVAELWQAFLARDRRATWSRPWALISLGAWLERNPLCA